MSTLEVIEKIYEKWDGTPDHACEMLRYINLVIAQEKSRNVENVMIQSLLTPNHK